LVRRRRRIGSQALVALAAGTEAAEEEELWLQGDERLLTEWRALAGRRCAAAAGPVRKTAVKEDCGTQEHYEGDLATTPLSLYFKRFQSLP